VAEFLTAGWFEDVNAAEVAVDPDLDLVLDQRVGDHRYRVTLGGGRLRVGPAGPEPADVTITLDRDTASALATGTLNANDAFLGGRVHFAGDVAKLGSLAAAVAALSSALAALRDGTSYQ
jgi:putative sterol carrier protein